MNIIFLGPVGSGKSTQAKLLGETLGIPVLSAGDLVYYAAEGESEEARKIKDYMEKGELIPDETMLELMNGHLKGNEHSKGTIIDGFPRTLVEAQMFSWPVEKVIYINISDKEAKKRLLLRERVDDKPEVIENRLRIYHEETEPVLTHYKNQGKLVEIPGEGTRGEVYERIKQIFIQ